MRLLPAAWRQKRPAAAWLRRKGAVTKQPQVKFPFQDKRSRRACLPSRACRFAVNPSSDERAQQQTRVLPAVEEHVAATTGGSVLASQDAARKERARVVAVQPQYTAEQLSVEIRVEIRCPLDMSRGQRISSRISVIYHCRLYCAAHFAVNPSVYV